MRHNLDVRVRLQGEEGGECRRGDQRRDKVLCRRRVLEPCAISRLSGEAKRAMYPSGYEPALMRVAVVDVIDGLNLRNGCGIVFTHKSTTLHLLLYIDYIPNEMTMRLLLTAISLLSLSPVHDRPDGLEIIGLDILILQLLEGTDLSSYLKIIGMFPRINAQQDRPIGHRILVLLLVALIQSVYTGVVTIANSPPFLTSQPHPLP